MSTTPSSPSPSHVQTVGILSAAVVAISMGSIFTRLADAPGPVLALGRMVFASLVIGPSFVRAVRTTWPNAPARTAATWAGIALALHFATWLTSLRFTSVAASVTLVTTLPIWVTALAWIGGRRPKGRVLAGLLLATIGAAIVGFGDFSGGSRPLVGNLLALAGALSGAAYFLLGRRAQRLGMSTAGYAGWAYLVAAIALVPLPAIVGEAYVAWPLATWGWTLAMALVPQLIGHGGLNWAQRHVDPTRVATLMLLEPVGAGILAAAVFGELPAATVFVGAPLTLWGLAWIVGTPPSADDAHATP